MFSSKITGLPLFVYMCCRCDIEQNHTGMSRELKKESILGSGLSLQTIAQLSKQDILTIKKQLDFLSIRGMIKQAVKNTDTYIQLGIIENDEYRWFLNTPREKSCVLFQIKKLAKEREDRNKSREVVTQKLSRVTKQRFVSGILKQSKQLQNSDGRELLSAFLSKFKDVTGKYYEIPTDSFEKMTFYSKNIFLMKRYLQYSDNNFEDAKRLIEFTFDNWNEIKEKIEWQGIPSISLFCTVSWVKTLKRIQRTGTSKKTIGKRYDKLLSDKDPDVGF